MNDMAYSDLEYSTNEKKRSVRLGEYSSVFTDACYTLAPYPCRCQQYCVWGLMVIGDKAVYTFYLPDIPWKTEV